MTHYAKRYGVLLLMIILTAGSASAAQAPNTEGAVKTDARTSVSTGDLETPHGKVYVGMRVDKLYDVFQEKDRILIPEAVLNRECHVFKDWTSNNPNDTITFFVSSGKVTGWHRGFVASCQNEGSMYEYDNNTHVDIWFFPSDKAKWDGSKLSILDWNQLSQAQKVMFMSEYLNQLNKQYNSSIDIDIDKYVLGMNYYSSNCPESCEIIPATGAVKNLLISDGKMKEIKK